MRSRAVTAAGAVAALLVGLFLVTLAATGGSPSLRVTGAGLPDLPRPAPPSPTGTPTASPTPRPGQGTPTSEAAQTWFGWLAIVLDVLAAAVVVMLMWWLVRKLVRIHRRHARRHERVEVAVPEQAEEAAREALQRAHAEQLFALQRLPPRNAVVRCWMLFERAASDGRVERRPSETSTEFVIRLLHAVDVDPAAVGDLLHLYSEARFSSHPVTAGQVARARRALAQVHADLAQPPSTRPVRESV